MAESIQTDFQPRKILVAQASAKDRAFVRFFLELIGGYQIIEAPDGVALIKNLKQRPDLILMDTVASGKFLRALEIMRRTPALKHTPIAVYSHEQHQVALCVRKGADGFIVKPTSPATLLGKIWKLLGAESRKEVTAANFAQKYRRDLEGIDNLPTLPMVYAEVSKLCKDPDVGADKLSSVIETDPSITLKLLNLANSAFFGFSRQIKSVRDAISLLGNKTVHNAVLNIAVFEATKNLKETAGLDKAQFWLHASGVGSAARVLSQKLNLNRDEAFTAGIVHDMGKLVLDALYTDFYADVLEMVKQDSISIRAAEEHVIGLDHALIGRELAESWNLPPELIDAVAFHHRPGRAAHDRDIACLTHLGDVICRKLGVGSGGDPLVPEIDPFALSHFKIGSDKLTEWEPEIQEATQKDQAILTILRG